jgi:hypothetical protein
MSFTTLVSSQGVKIPTYLLRGGTVLVELWPPHILHVRFRDSKCLQGAVVSPTPNPQPGWPGYFSYSDTSLEI